MKKLFLFAVAAVAAMAINAQTIVTLNEVANYIDFQALSVSDPAMTAATVTSTAPYELANGSLVSRNLTVLRLPTLGMQKIPTTPRCRLRHGMALTR